MDAITEVFIILELGNLIQKKCALHIQLNSFSGTKHHQPYYCTFFPNGRWSNHKHSNCFDAWSKWFQQGNMIVDDDKILVCLLIWLQQSLWWMGYTQTLCSKQLQASIIIWPCWRALAQPYASVSVVTVSQWRVFGSLLSCRCSLLVFAAPYNYTTLLSVSVSVQALVFVRQR